MTNPTSNFGWQMPTSTDLVTDLPADFEIFGQAVDTSLADLKGGTTGQVLSKASNTNMDFTWVTTDDANAIQNSIVDAKGDIVAASANDTPARLAVGNNGETLVADSSTSTGLRYQSTMAAGRNAVINGAFDIWQRGTSIALASFSAYCVDRWLMNFNGSNSGMTVSRQATGDTTNLPNIQYCARVQRNSGQTNTNTIQFNSPIETANSIPFAGKTVTLSFYARAGANYSSASSALSTILYTGTGTDQTALGGYTGSATAISTSVTLTTTWQRFSATATLASNVTEINPWFQYVPSGTAGANDYFEITGVQLEVGAVATQFTRAGGTIQGELAACQRYYWLIASGAANLALSNMSYYSATDVRGVVQYPVTMRTTPSVVSASGTNYFAVERNGTTNNLGFLSATRLNSSAATIYNQTTASGTAGWAGYLITNDAAASLAFSAEL